MKKILLLCAVAVLAACSKDDNKGQLDPTAMIALSPAPGVKADNPEHLSAHEIVVQTLAVSFMNEPVNGDHWIERGFDGGGQRDLVNNRLLMFGTDIISQRGEYEADFIEATDVVFVRWLPELQKRDTIAYIPNSVLREAQVVIKAAYDRGDYATCYSLFDKTYNFTPITGTEWRALKAEGMN